MCPYGGPAHLEQHALGGVVQAEVRAAVHNDALHRHAKALVQAQGAGALGGLGDAVHQAGELTALAGAHVSGLRGRGRGGGGGGRRWGGGQTGAGARCNQAPEQLPEGMGLSRWEARRSPLTRRVRAKSSGYTISREPAPARPPEARFTAKNRQKSVLELYLGERGGGGAQGREQAGANRAARMFPACPTVTLARDSGCHAPLGRHAGSNADAAGWHSCTVGPSRVSPHLGNRPLMVSLKAKLKAWVGK